MARPEGVNAREPLGRLTCVSPWTASADLALLVTPSEELDRAAAIEAWTAAFRAELLADGPATYVSFTGDEGADAVRDAYPAPPAYACASSSRRYDLDNVVRANHSYRAASCLADAGSPGAYPARISPASHRDLGPGGRADGLRPDGSLEALALAR